MDVSSCRKNPHLRQALNPVWRFDETVSAPMWNAITPLISEGYSKMLFWKLIETELLKGLENKEQLAKGVLEHPATVSR
jgi:hypothetical protein